MSTEQVVTPDLFRWTPIEELKPHPKNRNTHPPEQIERLAKIISYQGWRHPIIVSKQSGFIVAGHGRLEAAKLLKLPIVPVHYQDFIDSDQEYAFLISDNAIALWAELDLSAIHKDLPELGLGDLDFLGIQDFELEPDPEGGGGDAEAIPQTPAVPRSRLGELWHLGRHRLLVGDATKEADVARLMAGEQADLVFTDPPYNVDYEGSDGQKIQNDDMDDSEFLTFLLAAFKNYFNIMKEGAAIYVFHADTEGANFRYAFRSAGLKLSSCIIWNKSSLIMGRSDYHWKHEPCLYGWKPGAGHKWYGDRTQTTVFDHAKGSGEENKNHPTSKPVSLVEYFMGNSSKKGDVVVDFFSGGGSTLIAAEQGGRTFRGLELDPKYADVILQRFKDFTGQDPVREDGTPFGQL